MEKAYNHLQHEDKLYKQWEQSGKMRANAQSKKKPFTIPLPPPNVTGQLHLGHAAMLAIEDIFIRFKKMTDHEVLWIPGTDHAAIATENVVLKALGKASREEFSREEFLDHCRQFANEKHDRIVTQMKKMGAWMDWSRECYTFDDTRSFAVNEIFQQLYKDGLIERGYRMINWSTGAQSVISDDELEWDDKKEPFYYIRCNEFVVGTVRPETKCADSPVMVHPTAEYVRLQYQANNGHTEHFIVSKDCFENQDEFKKVFSLLIDDGTFTVVETKTGAEFSGQTFTAQTYAGERKFVVMADKQAIDPSKGTGIMTISANHSAEDYDLVKRLGLKEYFIQKLDFDGKMTTVAGDLEGIEVFKARKMSGKAMLEQGLLTGINKEYSHRTPFCYRSGTVIEPMVSPQWFVMVDKEFTDKFTGETTTLKKILQNAVRENHVNIIPSRFEKMYFQWIDNLQDWCISRQIWWGHQIPVWYDEQGNTHLATKQNIYLARHGESEENAQGLIQGQIGSSLTEQGKQDALRLAHEMKQKHITKIISSPTVRAFETAQIVAKELGIPESNIKKYQAFISADYGELVGLPNTPENLKKIGTTGETPAEVFQRVQTGIELLESEPDENILVISHRSIISMMETIQQKQPAEQVIENRIKNSQLEAGSFKTYTRFKAPVGKNLKQDEDTLDTWFSSALWPMSPLGWPNTDGEDFKKFYPADILETGWDIIFFWVARMMMFGRYATGKYPFHTTYLHGLVCDEKGKKMSKSKGNGIDPIEVIDEVGADAVRLSLVIGTTPGNNIPVGKKKIKGYRNFVNKLWNAGRFVQMKNEQIGTQDKNTPNSLADKWILSRLATVSQEVATALEKYEISTAGDTIYHFVWDEFCAWYLECQKVSTNIETLNFVFQEILKLVHPLCPFVTETLWKELKGDQTGLLVEQSFPKIDKRDPQAEKFFAYTQEIITEIRALRNDQKLNPKEKINMIFVGDLHLDKQAYIKELAGIKELTVVKNISDAEIPAHKAEIKKANYSIILEIPFDEEAEKAKKAKEIEAIQKQIANLKGRLSNKSYVDNAPAALVQQTKDQLNAAEQLLKKLTQ
ncbi:hypothetical protein CSB37_00050 [bacterium DOLZORAL124_38_8]|nr:MAG: hypothetical protein CSB37_00050 [bacterium DOLZORAL124_38_8]